VASDVHDVVAELLGVGLGHGEHPSSGASRHHRSDVTYSCSSPVTDPCSSPHDLRHFYASLLIRHGVSVTTVQARPGHASAAETLDSYSHLWPDSDDRTRAAVDSVLGRAADSVRTDAAR
ncbi:tyrosine-type recombinase/integrase, partial [Geodermatophilus marinus]|uniref:tyrosine-type recombinase/integrase n=1 Tax=Geodermatophilus sp. LHW52908 TaxID=2303986 RepID=UPI000E7D2CC2